MTTHRTLEQRFNRMYTPEDKSTIRINIALEETKKWLTQKREDNKAEMEKATEESAWQIEARTILLDELLNEVATSNQKQTAREQ